MRKYTFLSGQELGRKPFNFLRKLEMADILNVLNRIMVEDYEGFKAGEDRVLPPETVILACLPIPRIAIALENLPHESQIDIFRHLATMPPISIDYIEGLEKRVRSLLYGDERASELNSHLFLTDPGRAIDVLRRMTPEGRKRIIAEMEGWDPELGENLKQELPFKMVQEYLDGQQNR